MTLRLVPAGENRGRFLPLFLLADDSLVQIRSYYRSGDLYVLDSEAGSPIGLVLAIRSSRDTVELKAVAVIEALHGQGIGKRMLGMVLERLRSQRFRRVIVGTANSSIGQIAFYQKAGFRLWKIERNYFGPRRGYPAGAEEDGIPLRDMVWMDRDF